MATLQSDVRQFFAYSVLDSFERLAEANIGFTFDSADIYLSTFAEAFDRLDTVGFLEQDRELLRHAQVFERFLHQPMSGVSRQWSALISGSLYWLAGYSANALVLARAVGRLGLDDGYPVKPLIDILARRRAAGDVADDRVGAELWLYLATGEGEHLNAARAEIERRLEQASRAGPAEVYVGARLTGAVLNRLARVSLWASVLDQASAPAEAWRQYMDRQLASPNPLFDLWPSQRAAISKGLLDGRSSLVLQVPTSAGKTKVTELAFFNDLSSDQTRRCLYLAPFRSLVGEVEIDIGGALAALGMPVASLYGGSEANEIELALTAVARVLIATPEKIAAVLRLSGGSLRDFGTIVLDEGHLLDSASRGAAYELQLASLRAQLAGHTRTIFLSAVLPNADEIAGWLGGSPETLVAEEWQPTALRVGVVTWPAQRPALLTYVVETGQPLIDRFFVPRILEKEEWRERNPQTGRQRLHRFPRRGDNAAVAAALAFLYARVGPVIIYARRRDWAEGVVRTVLERANLARPIATHLVDDTNRDELNQLSEYLREVLGEGSMLPEAVRKGLAYHHAGLPQSVKLLIEDAFRRQTIRLLVATSTLAQGVNLPAKTVIVHSLPDSETPIRDFWNLVGRAGRATRETEGEVVILATGTLRPDTIRRFVNRGAIEGVQSVLLSLVRAIIARYPAVSPEAISAVLTDEESGETWRECVDSVDMHLLSVMAEDLGGEERIALSDALTANLLATYQAGRLDLESGTTLADAVKAFVRSRADLVFERVPDAQRRIRFARVGLSLDSCLFLDDSVEQVLAIVRGQNELSAEAIDALVAVACSARELRGRDPNLLGRLSRAWLDSGRYGPVLEHANGALESLDAAVRYVEDEICYRLPWILNGLLRLLEGRGEADNIPEWLKVLPDLVRYGTNSRQEMWVMSLGLPDRRFAAWLLERFAAAQGHEPGSFREFLSWAIASRANVSPDITPAWPVYFQTLYARVLDRYERIDQLLTPR